MGRRGHTGEQGWHGRSHCQVLREAKRPLPTTCDCCAAVCFAAWAHVVKAPSSWLETFWPFTKSL